MAEDVGSADVVGGVELSGEELMILEDERRRMRLIELEEQKKAGAPREEVVTITFGDRCENHVGMQIIGEESAAGGFSLAELKGIAREFKGLGCAVEMIDLGRVGVVDGGYVNPEIADKAWILIVRGGARVLMGGGDDAVERLGAEMKSFEWDSKAWMKGRVVNKIARRNVCFADEAQEPCYEEGRGRIVAWKDVAELDGVRGRLEAMIKGVREGGERLSGEGNWYLDRRMCGIGYHGDSERSIVIGLRLGAAMNLCFWWYLRGERIGERITLELNGGDVYFMSSKAVGRDWRRRNIYVLRHSAGAAKYVS